MKKLFFILAGAALGLATASAQNYSDLIISEYVEGSSNNKAIELFNGTGSDVDLSQYKLVKQVNGNPEKFSELSLADQGILKAGATFVITNDQSNCAQGIRDLANLQESNKIMNFNGNDAVILYKGETKIDVVGVEDSEDNWGMDVTLRRKCDMGPNPTYTPSEWETLEKDDYSGLGTHCGVDLTIPEVQKLLTNSVAKDTVKVYFTKELEQESAENKDNYTIEGLTVSAAILAEGNTMVTLVTSDMTIGTEYTLVINNVKGANGNKMETISAKFTFGYKEVADVAALCAMRETFAVGQKYWIKGEVVITGIIGNDAWIQDKGCETAKDHSMYLYYSKDLIPAGSKVGDVIKGVIGELKDYNGLLEMQYYDASLIENTGETAKITVDEVKINDIISSSTKLAYQNALVTIKGVTYSEGGEKFKASTNYKISDGTKTTTFRTQKEGDYIGETIPLKEVDVVVLVASYNGSVQVYPRTKEDCGIGTSTAVENNEAIRFSVYPNPTDGMLNVELAEGGQFSLFVYNTNGLQLMRREGLVDNARVDLSGLAHGMYIVEIRTAEGVVRTKVVVR